MGLTSHWLIQNDGILYEQCSRVHEHFPVEWSEGYVY